MVFHIHNIRNFAPLNTLSLHNAHNCLQLFSYEHEYTHDFLSLKGTVSPVYNYLKVIAFKSPWYEHMAPEIKSFFNCLFISW
jgi:hypothetical protein